MQILRLDAQFFSDNNIIDYSVLVGVHNRSEHPSTFLSRRDSMENLYQQNEAASPVDDPSPLNTLNTYDLWSNSDLEQHQRFY
mmetsp:Transcript_38125/g.50043  ORF Transcript_38125/g.50043 Transcript_38125/m.50043 type:complete len:83 (-) Transcript_38125:285-533(-)